MALGGKPPIRQTHESPTIAGREIWNALRHAAVSAAYVFYPVRARQPNDMTGVFQPSKTNAINHPQ